MKNKLEQKMLGVRLFEDEKSISLINGDSNSLIEIPKDTLANTILVQDDLFSDWIDKLKDESWCPINILYQIADIIKKTHPANTIDLDFQFFMIETKIYFGKVFYKKRKKFEDYDSLPKRVAEFNKNNIFSIKLGGCISDEDEEFIGIIINTVNHGFSRVSLNKESSSNMIIL